MVWCDVNFGMDLWTSARNKWIAGQLSSLDTAAWALSLKQLSDQAMRLLVSNGTSSASRCA